MGLNWIPQNKPQPGFETEFEKILQQLGEASDEEREKLGSRFDEISITPYETIAAPRIGYDKAANEWVKELLRDQDSDASDEDVQDAIAASKGFHVVPLAPDCDGIPRYSNGSPGGYVEPISFRGQFLVDCTDIIGEELLERGFQSMGTDELNDYGQTLIAKAKELARQETIEITEPESDDPQSKEFRLDVVLSAGRWCVYWAERGRGLEPYW